MTPLTCPRTGKSRETERRSVVARGWGWGGEESGDQRVISEGYNVSFKVIEMF